MCFPYVVMFPPYLFLMCNVVVCVCLCCVCAFLVWLVFGFLCCVWFVCGVLLCVVIDLCWLCRFVAACLCASVV